MTNRIAVIVAALLWAAAGVSASGQDTVPLRASYQGAFLPDHTEIVVIRKDARVEKHGRFQPEFFPLADFPTSTYDGLRPDLLLGDGRSSRRYQTTDASGKVYFLYALTPDSTVYWSYSAERDSLKFDVVNSGVMSVAPIADQRTRNEVLRTFFRARVTVHMPGGAEASRAPQVREPESADSLHALDGELLGKRLDEEPVADSDSPAELSGAQSIHASEASIESRPDEEPPITPAHAIGLQHVQRRPFARYILPVIGLVLGACGGALFAARAYRRETRDLKLEIERLRDALRRVAEVTRRGE